MASPVPDDLAQKVVKIMVVEDVAFNLEILTTILAERGWQTVAATSGEAALAILDQDADFQLILMDIGLPGMDGIEATRRIKENPATRAIPVIALTAETAAEQKRLLAAGLDGYAEKNFDPAQLFAAIERHLPPACGNRQEAEPALAKPPDHFDLDCEALLATYPDMANLRRITEAFFADTEKTLLLLGQALAAGDQVEILACCHSLGGSATIFTAQNLATAIKELDSCIRLGKKDEAESAWRRVLAAHGSLRQCVACRLNLAL